MKAMKKSMKQLKKTTKGVVYCRVSTTTNKNSASISRQKRAAEGAASRDKVKVVKNVCEIISGNLSLDKRTKITNILNKTKDKDIQKICVESAWAISRKANVAEEMYQKAKEAGVQIVPADIPDMCACNQTPCKSSFGA